MKSRWKYGGQGMTSVSGRPVGIIHVFPLLPRHVRFFFFFFTSCDRAETRRPCAIGLSVEYSAVTAYIEAGNIMPPTCITI
jgi:hypothetical protein